MNLIPYEKARQHAEYRRIPQRILISLYDYVNNRQQTGGFLAAVLSNDLFTAIGKADSESLAAIREIVVFIHMEVPSHCYGSEHAVCAWVNGRVLPEVIDRPAIEYDGCPHCRVSFTFTANPDVRKGIGNCPFCGKPIAKTK